MKLPLHYNLAAAGVSYLSGYSAGEVMQNGIAAGDPPLTLAFKASVLAAGFVIPLLIVRGPAGEPELIV